MLCYAQSPNLLLLLLLLNLWWVFTILWKMFSKKNSVTNSLIIFLEKIRHYCLQYDMKGCLRFYSFIFWISSNSAKYTYGLSPLEQQRKIEKNNIDAHAHTHSHTHMKREMVGSRKEIWQMGWWCTRAMMAGRHGNNNKRKSVEEGCQPFFSGYIYPKR
jgi:hypothetical protein